MIVVKAAKFENPRQLGSNELNVYYEERSLKQTHTCYIHTCHSLLA